MQEKKSLLVIQKKHSVIEAIHLLIIHYKHLKGDIFQ